MANLLLPVLRSGLCSNSFHYAPVLLAPCKRLLCTLSSSNTARAALMLNRALPCLQHPAPAPALPTRSISSSSVMASSSASGHNDSITRMEHTSSSQQHLALQLAGSRRSTLQQLQQQQQLMLMLPFYRLLSSSAAPSAASPSNPPAAPADAATSTATQQQPDQQAQEATSAAGPAESFINATAAAATAAAAAAGAGTSGPAAAAAASAGGVLTVVAAPTAEYTMRQVSKHATEETCWIVVNGKVYDVTSYIDDHPGGAESILLNAGVDCTEEFMGVHTQEAKELLEKFVIGRVKAGKAAATKKQQQPATVTAAAAVDPTQPLVALLDPRERFPMPLAEKRQLNHDTFFMRFALPAPQYKLGLPCGKHVFLCADIGGEAVVRAYTPISGDRDLGVLDFLIKVYWPNSHPRFPQGGKMTQHLAAMKEGDTIDVKGPYGKFCYEGHGQYTLNRVSGKARYLSMVAGGSGVTPCYSVLREVLQDPTDTTRCALIYANKHEEDIWVREELDDLARQNPDRLHVWYILEEPGTPPTPFRSSTSSSSNAPVVAAATAAPAAAAAGGGGGGQLPLVGTVSPPPAGAAGPLWTFSCGFITADIMAQHLLPPRPPVMPGSNSASSSSSSSSDGGSLALMCGPPGMLEGVVVPGLAAMGYTPEQMVVF